MTNDDFDDAQILNALKHQRVFVMTREEFVGHLTQRAEHHKQRSLHYAEKAINLEQEQKGQLNEAGSLSDMLAVKNTSNYRQYANDADNARDSARTHARQALVFTWYADHLVAAIDIIYLGVHDLATFELVGH